MTDLLKQIIDVQIRNVTSTTQTRDLNTTLILAKFTDSQNRDYAVYTDAKQALDDGHSLESYVYNAVRLILTQNPHPLRVVVAPVKGSTNGAYLETFRSLLRIPQGWFHLISDLRHDDTQFLLAQLVETTEKFYTAGTHNRDCLNPTITTDLASRIKVAGLAQTTVWFDDEIGEESEPEPNDPDPDPARLALLQALIARAELEVAKTEVYTAQSLVDLQVEINKAKQADNNAKIDRALLDLQQAIDQLEEKPILEGCEGECQAVSALVSTQTVSIPSVLGSTPYIITDIDGITHVRQMATGNSTSASAVVQSALASEPNSYLYGLLEFENGRMTNLQNKCVKVRIGVNNTNEITSSFVTLQEVSLCANTATAYQEFVNRKCEAECQNSWMPASITDSIEEFGTYTMENTSAEYTINVNGVEYTTEIDVMMGSKPTRGQVLSNIISSNMALMNKLRFNYETYRVDNVSDECLLVYVLGKHSKKLNNNFVVIKPILICPQATTPEPPDPEENECDANCITDSAYGDSYMPLSTLTQMYIGEGQVVGKYIYAYNGTDYDYPMPDGVDFGDTAISEIYQAVTSSESPLSEVFVNRTNAQAPRYMGIQNTENRCVTLQIFYAPTTPVAVGYERIELTPLHYFCPNGVDKTEEILRECEATCVNEVLASSYVGVEIPSGVQTVELRLWVNGVAQGSPTIRNVTNGAVSGTYAMSTIASDSAVSYSTFRTSPYTAGAYYNPQGNCNKYDITVELQGNPSSRQYVVRGLTLCGSTIPI
jgi:hypothetical protein